MNIAGNISRLSSRIFGSKQVKDDSQQEKNDPIEDVSPVETKHSRESEVEESGLQKRARRGSEAEKRLIQNHQRAPRDAVPITVTNPGAYNAERDWRPGPQKQPQSSMAKHNRQGHRPLNTLNNPTPQSSVKSTDRHFQQFHNTAQTQKHQIFKNEGRSKFERPEYLGTEPEIFEPPAKKRRTERAGAAIDLTKDSQEHLPTRHSKVEDEDPEVGIAVGRARDKTKPRPEGAMPTSQPVMSSAQATTRNDISISQEQSMADDLMEIRRVSREQRPNGNDHMSQTSAREMQDFRRVQPKTRQHVPAHEVITVDGDDFQPNMTMNSGPRQKAHNRPNGRPPIELDKGMPEYPRKQTRRIDQVQSSSIRGSRNDIVGIDRASGMTATEHKDPPQVVVSRRGPDDAARNQRTKASRGSNSEHFAETAQDNADTRLARTFVRDDQSVLQTGQTKRKDKMQSSSRQSLPSEDELCGETTVPSRSRNSSPNKQTLARGSKSETPVNPNRSSHEPSAVKRSNLTRTGKPLTYEQPQAQPELVDEQHGESLDDNRIPIKAIYHRAYVSDRTGLSLCWENILEAFVLLDGNMKVRVHNELIKVGPREASKCKQSQDLPFLFFQGAANPRLSNGSILVEFHSTSDATTCYKRLDVDRDDIPKQKMLDLVKKQKSVLAEAHQRFNNESIRQNRAAASHTTQTFPIHDEEIRYETQDSHETSWHKVRDRMRGDDSLASEIVRPKVSHSREHDETKSRFWDQPRRSTRQSNPITYKERSPSPEKWSKNNNPEKWKQSVVYPDQGLRRVTVDFPDIERLDEGEFLNDNLVSFELRWIEENMAPEHREKVHFFNTYFFTSLSQKNGKKDFNYDAVKRWTKKVDLFTVPYTVVPINVDTHWIAAIICNLPALVDRQRGPGEDQQEVAEDAQMAKVEESISDVQDEMGSSAQGAASPRSGVFEFDESGQVKDEMVDHDEVSNVNPGAIAMFEKPKLKYRKKKAPSLRKYDSEEPIIMSLDSFALPRSSEMKYLKLYVSAEAQTKRGINLDYKELPSMSAKGLPEQPNFCDCGVYLVGYIAEFAKDPDAFVRKVLTREMDRNNEFADFNASAKRAEIRNKLFKLNEMQEAARAQQRKAKAAAKKTASAQAQTSTQIVEKTGAQHAAASRLSTSPVPPRSAKVASDASGPIASSHLSTVSEQKPAPDDDNGEMEVQAPAYLDPQVYLPKTTSENRTMLATSEQSSDKAGSVQESEEEDDDDDDDDDEMLFDGAEEQTRQSVIPEGTAQHDSRLPRARHKRQVPDAHLSSQTEVGSPLRPLERWATEPVQTSPAEADARPTVLDLGDESQHEYITISGRRYERHGPFIGT